MNLLLATSLILLLAGTNWTSGGARHSFGRFNKRIINGKDAGLYEIPYQVMLCTRSPHGWVLRCGGVLIRPDKVLTAAHCMNSEMTSNFKVFVGRLNRFGPPTQYEQSIDVQKINMHKGYVSQPYIANDIAILTLATPAALNRNVKVVKLADNSSTFFNTPCLVSGWGRTNASQASSINRLQKTSITILSKEECISYMKLFSDQINNSELVCVLDKKAVKPGIPCSGDSGGPLFCGPRLDMLVGITSFGKTNCTPDHPVMYTDVTQYYRSWIETNL